MSSACMQLLFFIETSCYFDKQCRYVWGVTLVLRR